MSRNAPSPPDVSTWHAQYLRLVAFPVESFFGSEQTWWNSLTQTEPEISVRKGQNQEVSGPFGENTKLVLEIDPFRISWTASPILNQDRLLESMPLVGPFVERRRWFTQLMLGWLEACPPLNRLAFNARLFQPASSKDHAYSLLNRYLRCVDVEPSMAELMFRVNRRRESQTGLKGLRLNCLTTWACATVTISLSMDTAGVGQPIRRQGPPQVACVLELDINTDKEYAGGPFSGDCLRKLFAELVDLGTEFAARGDG